MDGKLRTLLLLLKNNADTSYLIRKGLTFSQISGLFKSALDQGFLKYEPNGLCLTESAMGALRLTGVDDDLSEIWVVGDERYVIPKIGVNDVYLPRKKDIRFF